ncbi:MAG: Crp/Fnr family transcriptional regulator [Chloroflexota bacterium]|jgi:hypothetical protein|nr:Crp/Fnr family transcriptional regulator [Chloroflexota bacterium]
MVRDRLESDPTLGMALFEIAGERLREAQNLAESLAFDAVLSRVANLLLELTGGADPAAGETVVLDTGLTHQQMAGLIGTTRETFTSTISRLAASRIVRPQRLRLEILDRGAAQLRLILILTPLRPRTRRPASGAYSFVLNRGRVSRGLCRRWRGSRAIRRCAGTSPHRRA